MIYYQNQNVTLYKGDCLQILPQLDIKVDCVITDLPYGTTKNKWDCVIPFQPMWKQLQRLTKDNGAICLFGQDKFSAKLILSNEKKHKYNLIWKKGERTSGFLNAKRMPLRNHEDIMIFYSNQPTYNPQMVFGSKSHSKGKLKEHKNNCYGKFNFVQTSESDLKYPKSIVDFDRPHPPIHPTQKPVSLIEYLIKTYSNENDLILDFTSGSGTTGIACMNTNRRCILIQKQQKYCQITVERLKEIQKEKQESLF